MPARVQILPETLTNKIAAGEVIERPASVLKELLENALDAGARRLTVKLEAGGRSAISVIDDGSGMSRDDAVLAVERYATSKIANDNDLYSGIRTYGFRGEALPSIGAVARLTIRTRPAGSDEGTEVVLEGGRLLDVRAAGVPVGTEIVVRDLFFNTPVRRKFLKPPATELSACLELIHRIALAQPDVAFHVEHEGRVLLEAEAGEDLVRRAARIIGEEVKAQTIPIAFENEELKLTGRLSTPDLTRSNRRQVYTYVNRRVVNDPVFNIAIQNAYRTLVFPGRYPVVVLFLDLPAESVDVNVHPTKIQVKFRDAWHVREAVEAQIRLVLSGAPWLGNAPPASAPMPVPASRPDPAESPAAPDPAQRVQSAMARFYERPPTEPFQPPERTAPVIAQPVTAQAAPTMLQPKLGEAADGYYSRLRYLGQVADSFLVCDAGEEGLVLIDQHAAQERINFEKLRRRYHEADKQVQTLLFPIELQPGGAALETFERNVDSLRAMGLVLDRFGDDVLMLKGAPKELVDENLEGLLKDLLDALSRHNSAAPYEELVEELFATMACKRSITARMSVEPGQVANLLAELDRFTFATNCPHGRPIRRSLSVPELYRMFKR